MASIIDPDRVSVVVALDPVDINPVEFSNSKGHNLPLNDDDEFEDGNGKQNGDGDFVHVQRSKEDRTTTITEEGKKHNISQLVMCCTDGGRGIPKSHNADAIHKFHPATICYHHTHSGHMAYCDSGGGWAGKLMPNIGTRGGNSKAMEAAHTLIRQLLG